MTKIVGTHLAQIAVDHSPKGVEGARCCPLTPMQIGLIYESAMVGKPWINLEQIVGRLNDEPISVEAMQDAWQWLTDRHAILRTSFHWQGRETPEQVVHPSARVRVDVQDLSAHPAAKQEEMLSNWLAADRNSGTDLGILASWRVTWFRLAERRSVLVWTFHHALLDGRSFSRLLREVMDYYTAGAEARKPRGELGLTTPSFAEHCMALEAFDLAAAEAHFRRHLAGFDTANHVDLGGEADALNERMRLVDRITSVAFGNQLKRKAKETNVTVATLVQAAWGLVVARCSNRNEAVFGVTLAGRHLIDDGTKIAGCLINTVPARIAADSFTTIDTLLTALRKDLLAVRPFEHAPLSAVTRWSEVPAHETLFESAVMFERSTLKDSLRGLGGAWSTREFDVLEEGALPLTLSVYDNPEMFFRLEYAANRYSADCARRLLEYTLAVLEQFASLPGHTELIDLDMLPTPERNALIGIGCPPKDAVPKPPVCLIREFEKQVKKQRGKSALSMPGNAEIVSYGSLDRRANRLANLLKARGIGSDDLVALCLPRSYEFVVAMLAVMKTGAGFVPVDPAYPGPTIAHMLLDSDAASLITMRDCIPEINPDEVLFDGDHILILDDCPELEEMPDTPPDSSGFSGDRAAYVIFTSGTSGKPKGVKISHNALAEHVCAITKAYGLSIWDHVPQIAGLSFDVSLEEILPTLLSGASLVLRSAEMVESMGAMLDTIEEFELTVLNLPTGLWHTLVEYMEITGARLPKSVRLTIVGGETASPDHFRRWRAMVPNVRFLNGYGPTEATITATLYDAWLSSELAVGEEVPIGRPLTNTRAFVVCPDGSLSPRGAKGELLLGGCSVATGYLGHRQLTAERFVKDRFAGAGRSDRMYRTGDVARWRPDGNLAHFGRIDRQVKINGYRIELREIEQILEARDDVGLAVASVENPGTPRARLLAWATPMEPDNGLEAKELRCDLLNELPHYKVPDIVVVDALPRTPGGKTDIKALPRPNKEIAAEQSPKSNDPVIKRLSEVFSDLLGVSQVGPDSSFFDLGGHSLLAVRLIGTIEVEFGRRISVSLLHEARTPAGLAQALKIDGSADLGGNVIPIQPNGTRPPIFGVHVLGQNERFFRPLADQLGPNQPLFGLTAGLLSENSPTGVRETAALYFNEIQRHCPDGPICLAAVSQGSFIAYELAQKLSESDREVAVLALFDAAGPAGRPSLKGTKRLKTHLALLRQQGPGYLSHIARNRWSNLRNSVTKALVKFERLRGKSGMSKASVERFVAANSLAIENYEPDPYPHRLTVFRARESVFDAESAIASGLGWREVASGGLDLIDVPGEHLSMLELPHIETLAVELTQAINRAALSSPKPTVPK